MQVENNHRLIRRILPKSTSFNTLTKEETTLLNCHLNSVLREHLNNQTPFALMSSDHEK